MKNLPFGRPMIGDEERRAVLAVLDGPTLVHGPRSHEFEASFADYTQAPHAVSVSSCTAGMHLVWFSIGLGPGDEVVVPAETHTATAHAVELTGATPVFVDADSPAGNVTIAGIEAAITPRTRGIAVVHYLGEPVDMAPVVELARSKELFLLEDCALAIGTYIQGVHAGLVGDAGCFSFYPVKHMTTAEGGMVITRHADLAERLTRQRAFGVDRTPGERTVPGVYDVTMLGFNYRMNEIQAAIGIEQLVRLPAFLSRRRENFLVLLDELTGLEGIAILPASEGSLQSSYYCLAAILAEPLAKRRIELVEALRSKGIGTSVYYPSPVPHLAYYRQKYGFDLMSFPAATRLSGASIALPVGPHLEPDDMRFIGHAMRTATEELLG